MKLKLLSLILIPVALLSGCKAACEAEKIVVARLASAVAAAVVCSNVQAIQDDVLAAVDVVKLCAVKEKRDALCEKLQMEAGGPIADLVCPLATSSLVSIVGNQVPVRYGCKLTGSPLHAIVLKACQSLPF